MYSYTPVNVRDVFQESKTYKNVFHQKNMVCSYCRYLLFYIMPSLTCFGLKRPVIREVGTSKEVAASETYT